MSPTKKGTKPIASNRKAFHDYHVLDRMEAGLALVGTEVKALRDGHVSLAGGFASADDGEVVLHDVNIATYEFGNQFNHDPTRPRKLLLHRAQIVRLAGQVAQKGYTLIPLSLYFRDGKAKVELGVCKGKVDRDKREDVRRRDADREASRAVGRG